MQRMKMREHKNLEFEILAEDLLSLAMEMKFVFGEGKKKTGLERDPMWSLYFFKNMSLLHMPMHELGFHYL